ERPSPRHLRGEDAGRQVRGSATVESINPASLAPMVTAGWPILALWAAAPPNRIRAKAVA
ncbi:hypothetical protein, partial [Mesorhizobium sp.]|uniref:hypothetical protein n=1 Tax=Mesorhizobium sp. TaxID=1871066 RepID=UPI0025B7E88C